MMRFLHRDSWTKIIIIISSASFYINDDARGVIEKTEKKLRYLRPYLFLKMSLILPYTSTGPHIFFTRLIFSTSTP